MKKLGILIMPLMAMSLLASCGGNDPGPTPTVVHNLIYVYDNGTTNSFTEKYIDDEKTKEPTWTPTYDGYTFVGWYEEAGKGEEGTKFTFGSALTGKETTIHAHWSAKPPVPGITHNIYLDPCGGTFGQDQPEVLENISDGSPVIDAPDVTREGYGSPTWWTEVGGKGTNFTFGNDGTHVTHDYFLHAYWGEEHPSKYNVSFIGDDCTGKTGTMTTGVSEFQTDILYEDFNNVTITVNPKTDYHLLTTGITVLKNKVTAVLNTDYTYAVNENIGTVTLKSKGDFLVKVEATPDTPTEICSITFDAGDGVYPIGKSKITLDVTSGTKLSTFIKQISQPTLENQTFAYYTHNNGSAIDYDDVITDDVELKAHYFNITSPLSDLDSLDIGWDEIKAVAVTNYNPSYCFQLGATKKVQLTHQDTAGDGADIISGDELYQTVRIIGFNEDYTELPTDGSKPDSNKAIGITFEFKDLISDNLGYSLATQWYDTAALDYSNHNYLNSSIRYVLNKKTGTGGCDHILWAQKGATEWSNVEGGLYTNKSVLDMLPDGLTKDGILSTPSKYINIWNEKLKPEAGWEEQVVNDKLFLLSPAEMDITEREHEEPSTTVYSYYENSENLDRVKKQIKTADKYMLYGVIPNDKGQTYYSNVLNFAGSNFESDSTEGGYSWLRSPLATTNTSDSNRGWCIEPAGSIDATYDVRSYAFAIAPAFCI